MSPIWFWLQVGFWGFVVLIALAALAWVYRNFGWWGVGVALTIGVSAAIFKKGYDFGKLHGKPVDAPVKKPKRPIKKLPPVENAPGTWNYREGRWN